MKILWIVNTIFPYPAKQLNIKNSVYGGWLNSLFNELKKNKNFELCICSLYSQDKLVEYKEKNVTYFLLPGYPAIKYKKNMEENWKKIDEIFKPDIVFINGTEYTHGLAYVNACPQRTFIVSIQGLVSEYAKVYYGNLSVSTIIRNISLRDLVKKDSIIQQKRKFVKRGKNEIDLLKKVKYITGRTIWDYSNVKNINNNIIFFGSNRILREDFYKSTKWDISKIERYSIFCSQASYPIKGIHYVIEAINIIKKQYPNVKLKIAGRNIINVGYKINGYGKIIKKMIKKYCLDDNIIFLGEKKSNEMVDNLLKSHIFVQSSAIENSPNSLGEAMMLGVPCIASFVGGTMNMLEHEKEGLLYTYTEPAILAQYIIRLFEDDNLCLKFSANAIKKAEYTHNKERIINENIEMYKEVYHDNKK